ncbi:MAG: hypothetical protein V9E94_18560 [Microthrixaceae bacterium]
MLIGPVPGAVEFRVSVTCNGAPSAVTDVSVAASGAAELRRARRDLRAGAGRGDGAVPDGIDLESDVGTGGAAMNTRCWPGDPRRGDRQRGGGGQQARRSAASAGSGARR